MHFLCIHIVYLLDMSPGFGTKQVMGHVDFYVNGGSDQPGCANNMNQHLLQILKGNFSKKISLHFRLRNVSPSCIALNNF